MRMLIALLMLGVPTWVGAQGSGPATGAPESFSTMAQVKNGSGTLSASLEVTVTRYTPEFDRKAVEEALRLGGYPRFLMALRAAPEVGQLTLGGNPFTIRYARETIETGIRTILLVTDKPVFFAGAGLPNAAPKAGFEVALLQIKVDAAGRSTGTLAAAARVRPDGSGGVLLDTYAEEPIALTGITRKPS
jgi:hypothetical protein